MPENALLGFVDHGRIDRAMPADGGNADATIEEFRREGSEDGAIAATPRRKESMPRRGTRC